MDPSAGLFDRYVSNGASYFPYAENHHSLARDSSLGQTCSRRDWETFSTRYDGVAPWAASVVTPGYIYPQSHEEERVTSDQDTCSEGSTWSPGSSIMQLEAEMDSIQSPRPQHRPHCALDDGQAQDFSGIPYSSCASEATYSAPSQSGLGIKLQDVQQYPDAYQEDSFHTASRPKEKVHYAIAEYLSMPGTPVNEYCPDQPTAPFRAAMAARITVIDRLTKEETASDTGDESDLDYKPMCHKKTKAARPGRQCRQKRTQTMRANKSKPEPKAGKISDGIIKRPAKALSLKKMAPAISGKVLSTTCDYCQETLPTNGALSKHISTVHTRPFTCTFRLYGCPSTFGSKNEWKRHVSSQHLRLGIWRCDYSSCLPQQPSANEAEDIEPIYNDFNRKDLFTQHLRRMHFPSTSSRTESQQVSATSLDTVSARCWIGIRKPPSHSVCGYCADDGSQETTFSGEGSWETRMEHVGRHLESGRGQKDGWREDVGLRQWMVKEGLVEEVLSGTFRLAGLQVTEGKSGKKLK
ncbi:hypothetical protein MMC19_004421 [Ptychographa xylographoides]|nr:hypothetical protein [Ptychographa xylographoides]